MKGMIQPDTLNNSFQLVIRQQPVHSRMCGIGERVDRRPIDPPPVVQIKMNNNHSIERLSTLSSYLFLIAVLVPADGRQDQEQLNILLHSKLTVGRTVSSLYILRDLDSTEGAFFVFSDISVRAEGNYRLRMCLFDIREQTVHYNASVTTEPFTVYSAKTFPGMYRSCPLVQNFAKQGLKIRIRKESGPRPSRYIHTKQKDIRKAIAVSTSETSEEDEEDQSIQPTTVSAFKRVTPPTPDPTTISTKRRLSLSYLLDQSDNDPTSSSSSATCLPDQYKLAPISIVSNTKTAYYHVVDNTSSNTATDLPSIIHECTTTNTLPSLQQFQPELPPIQHHIQKR